MDRRDALRSLGLGASAAATGMHGFATEADAEEVRGRVSTRSEPSQLKITDLRVVSVHRRWIVRVDTNQGLHGYGEGATAGAPPTPSCSRAASSARTPAAQPSGADGRS